jgi:hypothetical protein
MVKYQENIHKNIGYYTNVRSFEGIITEQDLFNIIKSESVKSSTEFIHNKYQDQILNGWTDKSKYQKDKVDKLQVVSFGNLKANTDKDQSITNLVCLDLDENTKQELDDFKQKASSGTLPFVRWVGHSVSGKFNGSLFLVVSVELDDINPSQDFLCKLGLTGQEDYKIIRQAVYNAYVEYITSELNRIGIQVGKNKGSKALRYIAYDPDIYFNHQSASVLYDDLEQYIEVNKKKAKDYTKTVQKITSDNWVAICDHYAKEKGFELADGQKHLYIVNFSIQALRLGVPKDQVKEYFEGMDINIKSNALSVFTNPKYKDSKGQDSHLLTKDIYSSKYHLKKDQYLSHIKDDIFKWMIDKKYCCLDGLCSLGKSYFANNELKTFAAERGLKTIIVDSLNVKAESDHNQYRNEYLTGERLRQAKTGKSILLQKILQEDTIITNQDTFPIIAKHLKESGQRAVVVIDEFHSLVKGFRKRQSKNLFHWVSEVSDYVLMLSGTPVPYFKSLGFDYMMVTKDRSETKYRLRLQSKDWTTDLINIVENDDRLIIAKYNSKTELKRAKRLLKVRGFKEDQILMIYTDNPKSEQDKYKNKLNTDFVNSFDNRVKIILTTAKMNEGLDIYSQQKDVLFLCFEKLSVINPKDAAQFPERWRTDKDKEVIFFVKTNQDDLIKANDPNRIKQDFTTWNPLVRFDKMVKKYIEVANSYQTIKFGNYDPLLNFHSFTNFESDFVFFCNDSRQYQISPIGIMQEIERHWMSICTTEKCFDWLESTYDHITVIDEMDKVFEDVKDLSDQIKTDKAEYNVKKEKALNDYNMLLWSDRSLLFQAVLEHSTDETVKEYVIPDLDQRDSVLRLIDNHKELFDDFLSVGESIVKRYSFFTSRMIEEDDIYNVVTFEDQIRPSNQLNSDQRLLDTHLLVIGYDLQESDEHKERGRYYLSKIQTKHIKKLKELIDRFSDLTGQRLSQSDILEECKRFFKGMNKTKSMEVVKGFFEVEKQNKDYIIKDIKSTSDWLEGIGLDSVKYLDKFECHLIEEWNKKYLEKSEVKKGKKTYQISLFNFLEVNKL